MNTNRVLTGIAVMAATIMQVLDTTIVNVALPNMAGQLDATPDNIGWVLTSYLIASAMIMPLTGYFTDRIGQKRFLLISIAGFVITSALCGMAASLAQMVLFRFLQGVFGAALVPLSQSIMLQIFPGEQRGKAMAIWSMGVMVAPIMGPTLGGWLTEEWSWRWTFYINLPVGIASFILAMRHVHDTPTRARRMDWMGFATLALGIGALQLVLDRGNQDDWFSSQTLVFAAFVSAASIIFFIVYTLTGKHHPLFDLRIFRDRNFLVASLIMTTIGITANDLIVPMMLQGMGMGLIFVPISTLAFTTLPKEAAAEAAGIYSLIRALGSALGISILATYFSRSTHQSWSLLRGEITPYSEALHAYLAPLHLGANDPQGIAIAARAVLHQAQNIGYIDSFWFATLNFVMMLPLLLLVRTPAKAAPAQMQANPE